MSLHVVLFQAEIPQNTGNIARTCACMGANLHVVHPLGFQLTPRNIRRSGMDYLERVEITQWVSSDAFLAAHGNDALWMFTGQSARLLGEVDLWKTGSAAFDKPVSHIESAATSCSAPAAGLAGASGFATAADSAADLAGAAGLAAATASATIAESAEDLFLCFGRESAGIDADILARYESSCIRIPMKDDARSLNLANAVAIGVYEAMRQRGFAGLA